MGSARDAFNKAVLTTVLTTSLFAGAQQSAFAKQSEPVTGAAATEQTAVTPEKPWVKDPEYIRQRQEQEFKEAERLRSITDFEKLQLKQIRENYTSLTERVKQTSALSPDVKQRSLTDLYQKQTLAETKHFKDWDAVYVRELELHKQFIVDLDKQFGDMPQYKGKNASGQQQQVAAKVPKGPR